MINEKQEGPGKEQERQAKVLPFAAFKDRKERELRKKIIDKMLAYADSLGW
ncbi:MAG: hypothetical protein M0036_19205 [Desulfobacteraceae bacterium]|nr:hypothetical protein [Desulfobacteraceae bacterium]